MADAIDLQTRLPLTWAAVEQLTLEDWVARKIVTKTRELPDDLARQVDADIAGHRTSSRCRGPTSSWRPEESRSPTYQAA